jgi:hypothetical protein
LKPVTQALTISTYKINNLDTFHDENCVYLIVALESGQVNIYQSMKNMEFQFLSQIYNHFTSPKFGLKQIVRASAYQSPD